MQSRNVFGYAGRDVALRMNLDIASDLLNGMARHHRLSRTPNFYLL